MTGNYEQKYKSALEWMRSIYPTMQGAEKEDAEHYFPELRESEDERMRKEIIHFIRTLPCTIHVKEEYFHWLEKQGGKSWSEEDEKRQTNIIIMLKESASHHFAKDDITKSVDWLNSLKDKIQPQPKQEWSEEDEKMMARLDNCIGHYYADNFITKEQQIIMEDWLKSLKDRCTWKPSDEQMNSLGRFIEGVYGCVDFTNIKSLYNELKNIES